MSMVVSLIEIAREPRIASYFLSFLNNMGTTILTRSGKFLSPSLIDRVWSIFPLLFLLLSTLSLFLGSWILVVLLSLDEEEGGGEGFIGEVCKGLMLD